MAESSDASEFDVAAFARAFDHHALEFGQNIDGIFRHMRGHCPVARTEAYGGFWVLTRYRDIVRVARDDETFSLRAGLAIPSNREPGDPPFVLPGDLDPPQSLVYRRLLEPLVTPAALTAMEPWVRQLARELVDGFIEKGEADLVGDLAAPLTAIVTLRLSGLPETDWPQYVSERRETAATARDPEEDMRRVYDRFTWTLVQFRERIEAQRTHPVEGGLIARLLAARIDGRPLEEWELIAILINFVSGGLETTQALLGSAWVHLARNPDQRDDLRNNLAMMPRAVEEMLRYFTPQPGLARMVTADTELGGVSLRQGEKVFMAWASANRDEAVFERADEFDIRRNPNRHLTFGIGAHHCLGANLTRQEARICMDEVLRRLPDYRVIEEALQPIPDVSTVSGYLSVPVTFTPAGRSDPATR
ncbi:MAG: cytochrome P450 [Sphingomonadales bacterium]|nr:cytochrome P450 [Sphingomonadales bacterium]